MGQSEIFEYLKLERIKGNHNYLTIGKVYDGLKERGYAVNLISVGSCVRRLARYDYLDIDMNSHFSMRFRLKYKYVGENGRSKR